MADRLAVGLFRIVVVLHAAMTVVQAVAAGGILQASTVGLIVHQAVGGTLLLVATVQVPLAVLAWRPGRLPAWPIGVSAALVVGRGRRRSPSGPPGCSRSTSRWASRSSVPR